MQDFELYGKHSIGSPDPESLLGIDMKKPVYGVEETVTLHLHCGTSYVLPS